MTETQHNRKSKPGVGNYIRQPISVEDAHDIIAWFGRHYKALKGTKDCPRFADFKISAVPEDCLEHLMLVAVEQPGPRFLYKIVGRVSAQAYGRDFSGSYLDELDFGGANDQFAKLFGWLIENRSVGAEQQSFTSADGARHHYQIGAFPFAGADDAISTIILVGVAMVDHKSDATESEK